MATMSPYMKSPVAVRGTLDEENETLLASSSPAPGDDDDAAGSTAAAVEAGRAGCGGAGLCRATRRSRSGSGCGIRR